MDAQKMYKALDDLQIMVDRRDISKSAIIDAIQELKDDLENNNF